MTQNQVASVMNVLQLYGPMKASRISGILAWESVRTYRVLVALEASGMAAIGNKRTWAIRPSKEAA